MSLAEATNTFTLLGQDGYSMNQTCQDPISTNFNTGAPCTYNTTSENSITTSTPITLFVPKVKQPSPKYLFLEHGKFEGASLESVAAVGVSPVEGVDLANNFIFNLRKDGCAFRNGNDQNIFYGDYVQVSIMDGTTRKYFSPGKGDNNFSDTPGDCNKTSWETFQVVKVGADNSISVAGNSAVSKEDNIMLINTATKHAINIGVTADGIPNNSAGLGTQTYELPQRESFSNTALTHEEFSNYIETYKPPEMPWWGWLVVAFFICFFLVAGFMGGFNFL